VEPLHNIQLFIETYRFIRSHVCNPGMEERVFQQTTLQTPWPLIPAGSSAGAVMPFKLCNAPKLHCSSCQWHPYSILLLCLLGFPTPPRTTLEVGWWPQRPEPQSAASMTVLWSFHTWNLQGQISDWFYCGLEQITWRWSRVLVSIWLSVGRAIKVMLTFFKDRLAQWMMVRGGNI
jgi:hypothetical protein